MKSKNVIAVSLILGFMMPVLAAAQTTTSASVQTLLDQIKALQAQIVALQQQRQEIVVQLVATLKEGSRGDQVTALQQMLSQDSSLYPEGIVSGYFGKLTAAAVKRFQKKHGIEQVGLVGPKTLKKLNELFGKAKHENDDDEDGDDDGEQGNHGNGTTKMTICHKGQTITVGAPAVSAHVKHGDTTGACGGGTATTTDTTAPIISAVSATALSTTGATILWTTNENATSQLEFGTTTSYGMLSALNSTLQMAHSITLAGLIPSTMYHFRVQSKDAANNTGTSSDMTFTTATPDLAAPLITGLSVGSIATTTATIMWNTNENATGKVYFGTVNPLVLGSATNVSTTTLSTGHSFVLGSLSASTTYYYVVESTDASSNVATSSQAQFTTTN